MQTLGKYEVIAELASGSMGVIYRGRDTVLDREVALKTISGAGHMDPELKERFYREARAGAKLHHPNVITVYELGEQDGLVFIALELLSGCDLRNFISERRQLPDAQKVGILAAVCDGLHHAHQHGIVHRDMKPSNVFLTDENVPKILDFGVARLSASKLTVVGRVLGTPFYMAPEQIMGQPCDERSDLFSLAIVGFELLTFCHPFAGSIPKRILNEPPDSLLARNPDLPAGLEPVFVRALAKDPAQRYPTVDAFGQALREASRAAWEAPPAAERTAAPPRPTPVPTAPPPAAPPEPAIPQFANTEYKMSAILSALQQFDEAMEARNLALARTALTTVEALAKVDERFATAARESRTRLQELEATLPPEPAPEPEPPKVQAPPPVWTPPPVVQAPPPAVKTMPPPVEAVPPPARTMPPPPATAPPPPAPVPPAQAEPAAPSYDATSIFKVSAVMKTPPPAPPRTAAPSAPRVAAPAPPPVPQPVPRPAAASNRAVLLVALAALALILIAIGVWLFLRSGGSSAAPVAALATARVASAQADIRESPADSADILVTLKKGDPVNVIRPPHSRSQQWTEVQYVSGKTVSPAGAIHTADLDGWSSTRPDVALSLVEMYSPGPGAAEEDLRQYAGKLSAFLQQFGGTPQQAEARAELDKTNAALAAGAASPEPAARNLPPSVPSKAAPAPPKSAPALNPDAELKRAEQAWEKGDYDRAEKVLKRLLQQRPDLAAASIMLQRVQKAKQLEGTR